MRIYKFPKWLRHLYAGSTWDFFSPQTKDIYLTFDDGPHPELTEYILNLLKEHDVKATFFCIGAKIKQHPELYQKMIDHGHVVANHSMTHPDGWKTGTTEYVANIEEAAKYIPNKVYRPPYGRIKFSQHRALRKLGYKSVFWSVVSYDFDPQERGEKFLNRMQRHSKPGTIFVFHDNPKAIPMLENELPALIKYWKDNHFTLKRVLIE